MSSGAENEGGDRSLAESSNLPAEPAPTKCKRNDKKCQRKNKRKKNQGRKNGQRAINHGKKGNGKSKKNNKRNKNKERNEPNPASASKHRATLVAEEGRSANDMINDYAHIDWSTNHKEVKKPTRTRIT